MQTKKALGSFIKQKVADVSGDGPLSQNADKLLERHAKLQEQQEAERQRHEVAANLPFMAAARKKADALHTKAELESDTAITTRFDLFEGVKNASRENPKDATLKRFATHLQKLWYEAPTDTISYGYLNQLLNHYTGGNKQSSIHKVVSSVLSKVSFNNLPVAHLTRIARDIKSQEDYNALIEHHRLGGSDLQAVRARAFIRDLVQRASVSSTPQANDPNAGGTLGSTAEVENDTIEKRVASRISQALPNGMPSQQPMDAQSLNALNVPKPPQTQQAVPPDQQVQQPNNQTPDPKLNTGVAGTGMMPTAQRMKPQMDDQMMIEAAFDWLRENNLAFFHEDMQDAEIVDAVNDYYPGGWDIFITDHMLDSDGDGKHGSRLGEMAAGPKDPDVNEQQEDALKLPDAAQILKASSIEQQLLNGSSVSFDSYKLFVDADNNVVLSNGKTPRKYSMRNMDGAINDYIYLVQSTPPPAVFTVEAGLKVGCPSCDHANVYTMPKDAEHLHCGKCASNIDPDYVTAALEDSQVSEVKIFTLAAPASRVASHKLAEQRHIIVAADDQEALANTWDKLVNAGFHQIADDEHMDDPAEEKKEMDIVRDIETDLDELRNMPQHKQFAQIQFGSEEAPMESDGPMPEGGGPLEEPAEGLADEMGVQMQPEEQFGWSDIQVIQAALMYYRSQGMDPVSAIAQFKKEYKDEFSPEAVLPIACRVWTIDASKIHQASAMDPKVNNQQPDAVSVAKGVLGKDTTSDEGFKQPKINNQVKPQGNFSNTSTEPGTESKDPGNFGAGKPKAQHPATEQKGVSLSDTSTEPDSSGRDNAQTKKWDSVSKSAQQDGGKSVYWIIGGLVNADPQVDAEVKASSAAEALEKFKAWILTQPGEDEDSLHEMLNDGHVDILTPEQAKELYGEELAPDQHMETIA